MEDPEKEPSTGRNQKVRIVHGPSWSGGSSAAEWVAMLRCALGSRAQSAWQEEIVTVHSHPVTLANGIQKRLSGSFLLSAPHARTGRTTLSTFTLRHYPVCAADNHEMSKDLTDQACIWFGTGIRSMSGLIA